MSLGVVRQLLPDPELLVVNPDWDIWPLRPNPLITYNGWVKGTETCP